MPFKKKTKLARVPVELVEWNERVMATRIERKLTKPKKDEISLAEGIRLAMTADSWKGLEWEMKNKSKRRKK